MFPACVFLFCPAFTTFLRFLYHRSLACRYALATFPSSLNEVVTLPSSMVDGQFRCVRHPIPLYAQLQLLSGRVGYGASLEGMVSMFPSAGEIMSTNYFLVAIQLR